MSGIRGRGSLQLAGWAAVGAGFATAALTVLTIGVFVLAGTAALAALLARRYGGSLAAPGLLAGAGLMPLYIAYLNRRGPGMACTTTPTGGSCVQEWSPWPFLAAGLCLIGIGFAIGLLRRRSRGRAATGGN